MPLATPTPATWTLRLKSNRTTIFLYVNPTTSWTAIKTELLEALRLTNTDGLLYGNTIPSSPDDVLLAKAIDANKLELGWLSLEPEDQEQDEDDDLFGEQAEEEEGRKSKGKGKAKAKGKAATGSFKDCPQGSGLRDNAAVAFRFRDAKPVEKQQLASAGLDEGFVDEDDQINASGRAGDDWDVLLPQYEDVYGLSELQPDDEIITPKANKFADFSVI